MEPQIISVAIRIRDPSFSARKRCLQENVKIEPADTQSKPGHDIFGTCGEGRPPNALPFQLVIVNSAILGTTEALSLKHSARQASWYTKQLLFPSRLEPKLSKYRLPPSSLRHLLPFVFAPLPLLCLRHCCLRYLPQFLKIQLIPKFQNVPEYEIGSFSHAYLEQCCVTFLPLLCQHTIFLRRCLMQ